MEVALRSDKGVADVYFCPMDSTAFNQYLAGLIEPLDGYLNDSNKTASDYDVKDFPDGFLQSADSQADQVQSNIVCLSHLSLTFCFTIKTMLTNI